MATLHVSWEIADHVRTYAREHGLDDNAALRNLLAIGRSVVRTPGICGGRPRVNGTRIPIWTLHAWWQQGASDTDIIADYPALTLQDLDAVRLWVQDHIAEVERDLAEQDDTALWHMSMKWR